MRHDDKRDVWIFDSTGREMYACSDIVGLSPSSLDATYGYDGGLPEADDPLTSPERVELADYMIGMWMRYRAAMPEEPK